MSERFASTLEESPHLGLLVRRIVLGTYVHDRETTENHIRILKKTPLVEDVRIMGYNGWLVKDYRVAVTALSQLRTLNISRYCLADYETDSFMNSQSALLEMIKGYPKLEQIQIPLLCGTQRVEKYCSSVGIVFSSN